MFLYNNNNNTKPRQINIKHKHRSEIFFLVSEDVRKSSENFRTKKHILVFVARNFLG